MKRIEVRLYLITIILSIGIRFFYSLSFANIDNPIDLPVPVSSSSHCLNESCILINPAFSDLFTSANLTYRYHRYHTHEDPNHLVLTNIGGFFFSLDHPLFVTFINFFLTTDLCKKNLIPVSGEQS